MTPKHHNPHIDKMGEVVFKPNMKWKLNFSSTDTIDSWTGGMGYYQALLDIELFGFKLVLWRKHK
jgi:hypothetical protein